MDRAEQAGLGVALAGHGALLVLLTLAAASTRLPIPRTAPIEVSFLDEVGPEATAPTPSAAPPAPSIAPDLGPPEEAISRPPEAAVPKPPAPVVPPRPAPSPSPRSTPTPAPPRQAAPPPASAKGKAATSRGSRFGSDFLKGIGADPSPSRAQTPPARIAGPAVEASLIAEVRRQVKPYWQRAVPTGADAESLKTQLNISLARDGRVTSIEVVGTTGVTASNRPQVALHQERARRAITLASPFELPDEYYDEWKQLTISLDLRLAR